MRQEVSFSSERVGETVRGWLYMPTDAAEPIPALVMANGFAATKEMFLNHFADVFCAAGLACLVFDYRNFGESDGEPRGEVDPWRQVADYRDAITFAMAQPGIDPERIGVWGSSFSGGHGIVVGAIDRRVRCVAVQVPTISGFRAVSRRTPPEDAPAMAGRLNADRAARATGAEPVTLPVFSTEQGEAALFGGPEGIAFYEELRKVTPDWDNEATLRSAEAARDYEPGSYLYRVSPTPLLMIVAKQDTVVFADIQLEAFQQLALEPKKLVLAEGGHFDCYVASFETASTAARDWFVEHLLDAGPAHGKDFSATSHSSKEQAL